MGMFDRQPNFGENYKIGDRFVLHGARYDGSIKTVHGTAEKSTFIIAERDTPETMVEYAALGMGFARQAKQAEASDFPVVVEYVSLPTGNEGNSVKLLAPVPMDVRDFLNGDNGPPADMEVLTGGRD